jgi:hypothetical protein
MTLPTKQVKNVPVWFPEIRREEYEKLNHVPYRTFPIFVREVVEVAIEDLRRQAREMKKPPCPNCGLNHTAGDPCPGPSYDEKITDPESQENLFPKITREHAKDLKDFGPDPVKLGLRRV